MSIQFRIVDANGLQPYVAGLRELEREISYPIAEGTDSFVIDHGVDYHPFFSEMGSKARFLVVLDKGEVVGSAVGVWKPSLILGKEYTGLYFADLKLLPQYRGSNISSNIFWYAIARWPFVKDYQGWAFAFFAAMHGDRGDVKRSFSSFHLGQMTRPVAKLRVFFVSPLSLLQLGVGPEMPNSYQGILLSSPQLPLVKWNDGKKDFRLRSTGEPWKLAHVQVFSSERQRLGACLQEAGRQIQDISSDTLACFAIDERLSEPISWLAENKIVSDTLCTVYSISFFAPSLRKGNFIVLSTGDI